MRSFWTIVIFCALGAAAPGWAQIRVSVDARNAALKVISVDMAIPAGPGPLTLYYPKWIPGEHRPDGPIASLNGLWFRVAGKDVAWRRDPLDAFTFHLNAPAGTREVRAHFEYIEPELAPAQLTWGASATGKLLVLNWNQVVLYPGTAPVDQLIYEARLRLADGWRFATALKMASKSNGEVAFAPTPLNRLVDSPLLAGLNFRAVDVTPPGEPIAHELDMVADTPEELALTPELQQAMKNLVAESGALFGTRHYRDYHFLFTLSDEVPHFGLEHHESDDSRAPGRTLLGADAGLALGRLLAHELTHSWNGKFRRPLPMSPPYYEQPMQDGMLWAYEGITNFVGYVLAARSGLWTGAQFRQFLANVAAQMSAGRPGREWRSLEDTGAALPAFAGMPGWQSWTRATDFHLEGALLWLEAAAIIHKETHGTKSFDDFCKLFYGGPNNGPELRTYTFEDLVSALNQVAPYDWAGFLKSRTEGTSERPPLDGIEASGWRLSYGTTPTAGGAAADTTYSIGLTVAADGGVTSSLWDSPAFAAGVRPGMKILAVNGAAYSARGLMAAVEATANGARTIELLVRSGNSQDTVTVSYSGGAKYPQLERIAGSEDYFEELTRARRR